MGHFEQLVEAAIEHLRVRLLSRGWSSTEIEGLSKHIQALNFPGLLALLATSQKRSGLLGAELITAAAQDVSFEASPDVGLKPGNIQRFLKEVLRRHVALSQVGVRESEGEELKRELFRKGVAALAGRSGLAPSLDQTQRIAELLATGEFFRDIGSTTAAVLSTARGLPIAIAEDVRWSPRGIRILFALMRDVRGTPASALQLFGELREGRIDEAPALLTHTLRLLYETASIASIAEMIRTLLAKDNETFRTAIVLYARSAGIPIEDDDLDVLRESVFNRDAPDLGPTLLTAIERLEENLGRDFLFGVIERL